MKAITRRSFIGVSFSTALFSGIVIKFSNLWLRFNETEFREIEIKVIESVMEVIIPSEDGLGAREARTIDYLLSWVSSDENCHEIIMIKRLVKALENESLRQSDISFFKLPRSDQEHILTRIAEQNVDEFDILWKRTVEGFLANPEYGGNHNYIGWKYIGMM